ncbi:pyridoxal phosphate-dependent aminotransferase [Kutzneria sp. NPDC051319]|uniref:pyridoxal phosphate-dependent aminotransferase n=1 Tax=Kutzneria sp. NPDC051319 TaxID=3155047 RepID=UPI003443F2DF
MISRRAAALPPSSTATLDAHVKKLVADGADVINLTGGELDFPTPDVACRGGIRAIEDGFTRYTAVAGIAPLRQAIANRLSDKWDCGYDGDDVIVTNGAKQALANVFSVLLDPGDEVVLQAPHWVSFPHMIAVAGGVPVVVETGPDTGYKLDPGTVAERITPHTKVLLLNSPSNPTGVVYDSAELTALARLAADHDLLIVSDEIYSDLVYAGPEFTSVAALGTDAWSRTITVGGFSKTFAMTGWRIGFAAGPQPVIAAMTALQGHTSSAPSSISQRAALSVLHDEPVAELKQRKAELDRRRSLACAGVADLPGLELAVEPRGAFFALVDVSGAYGRQHDGVEIKDAATFAERLLHEVNVAVMPGADFGAPDHIRISYAVSGEDITEAFHRIRGFLSR